MKKSRYTGVVGGDSNYPLVSVRGGYIVEAKSLPITNLTGSNITSVSLGAKFGGGNITTVGEIALQPSGITPNVYGSSSESLNVAIDNKGYITNIFSTPTIASDGYGEKVLTSINFNGEIILRYYIINSRVTIKLLTNNLQALLAGNFISNEVVYEIAPYKDFDFEVLCLPGYTISTPLRVYITKFGGITISGFSIGSHTFNTDYINYSTEESLFKQIASGVIDPIQEGGTAWEGTFPGFTTGNVRLEWTRFSSFVKGKLIANLTFTDYGVFRGATNEAYLSSRRDFTQPSYPNIDYGFIVPGKYNSSDAYFYGLVNRFGSLHIVLKTGPGTYAPFSPGDTVEINAILAYSIA